MIHRDMDSQEERTPSGIVGIHDIILMPFQNSDETLEEECYEIISSTHTTI